MGNFSISSVIIIGNLLTGLNPDSEHYQKVMRTCKPVSYEVKNYTKSGKEYWALTTLSPVMDYDGNLKKDEQAFSKVEKLIKKFFS